MGAANDIPEKFLLCRDYAHSWDDYNAKISRNKASRRREVHQVLICTRCSTTKTRVMTTDGEMLRSSYTYAPDYLLKDQGRLSPVDRAMIRAINFKKALKRAEKDEQK